MSIIYAFNGDADGICSAVQLYREAPQPDARVVTGRKRDINLLSRVQAAAGDLIYALDISMRSNMDDVRRLLADGAQIIYADHHNAGDIPAHKNLTAMIDTSPRICTAAIIDMALGGAYRAWAVTAAYGDNFPALAKAYATGHNLPLGKLREFGELLNYNGYGGSEADLHIQPAKLFTSLREFDTPMQAISVCPDVFQILKDGFDSDWDHARDGKIIHDTSAVHILELPNAAASRRISGTLGNRLALDHPARAHAILTAQDGGWLVSIRAPKNASLGADKIAIDFETGGGRAAAAGINHLPSADLARFIIAMAARYTI
ncbi:DHH family phosphoesterase [Robiginitomaculum antarcticum]|uniref:DHH family phosphoesterase n=1 Tax=Robiginitomaculum antarcticum TaxID=437507 RepID=UPI00037614A0|nr:DHH family phosphoesterase [Robiginitomaculum antarcticum]